jgi:hypothetical protein
MALLQSRIDAESGDINKAIVSFQNQTAAPINMLVIQPETEPSGSQTYSGREQPDGAWSIATSSGATILVHRFAKDQAARCQLNWNGRSENRVSLSVYSMRKTLQPGETLTLDSSYGVV